MSYLFGSPASFIDSVGDESEYYNESDKVRVDQLRNIFSEIFKNVQKSIKNHLLSFAFRILKKNKNSKIPYSSQHSTIKNFVNFLQLRRNSPKNNKLHAFKKLQQNLYNERKRQIKIHHLFCNKYISNQYKNIKIALNSWRKGYTAHIQTNRKIKSHYDEGKKKIGVRIILRILQEKVKNNFYVLSQKLKRHKEPLCLIRILDKVYRTKLFRPLNQIKALSNRRSAKFKDDPQIFDNILKHMCVMLGKKGQKHEKKINKQDKLIQFRIRKFVLILNRIRNERKREGFEKIKRIMIEEHYEFKQRARELQSIRLRYIEDFS